MKVMGIRELKAHMSEVIDEVSEGEIVEVTKNGKAVARLVPIYRNLDEQEKRAVIASLDSLAAQIGAHWQTDLNASEAVDEIRR